MSSLEYHIGDITRDQLMSKVELQIYLQGLFIHQTKQFVIIIVLLSDYCPELIVLSKILYVSIQKSTK